MPGKLLTTLRNAVPTVGVTTGPTFATNINSVLTGILDDLEPKVKASEFNVDVTLDMNSLGLSSLLEAQLDNQSATLSGAANARKLYVAAGNLRYVNDAGNDVGITSGSSLDTASVLGFTNDYGAADETARYTASGTFYEFLGGTTPSDEYAAVRMGALGIHETATASSNRVLLQAPSGLAGDYTWEYPASAAISGISVTGDLRVSSSGVLTVSETDTHGDRTMLLGSTFWVGDEPDNGEWDYTFGALFRTAATASVVGRLTLPLRVGDQIKSVQVYFEENDDAETCTVALLSSANGAAGVGTSIDSTTRATAGALTLTATETVLTSTSYYLQLSCTKAGSGGLSVSGVQVVYDRP